VVGVARDFAYGSIAQPAVGTIVTVQAGGADGQVSMVLRSHEPGRLTGSLRSVVSREAPDAARVDVVNARDVLAQDLAQIRLGAWVFSGFGMIALALGAGGVFGLVACLFETRRNEFGVRLALGSTLARLLRLALASALIPVSVGIVTGLIAALVATRGVASVLVGVGSRDPVTYVGVALTIGTAALAAAFIGARRLRQSALVDVLRGGRV
jgi:putative ABC transport system permease protein